MDLHGIGPSSAARLLADVANIHRFGDRDRFTSWNTHRTPGTPPQRITAPPPLLSQESQN